MKTATRTAARHVLVRRLIERGAVSTQEELAEALAAGGHRVTQATVSRDLTAIGATKELGDDGHWVYRLARTVGEASGGELGMRMREFVISIKSSLNLVVLSTPPGGAGPVAAALDRTEVEGVIGTIGGDDTVLVISSERVGGKKLRTTLVSIMES